jgi:hypothetical protein
MRGARVTVGLKGNRYPVGLPGSGPFHTEHSGSSASQPQPQQKNSHLVWFLVIVAIIIFIVFMIK